MKWRNIWSMRVTQVSNFNTPGASTSRWNDCSEYHLSGCCSKIDPKRVHSLVLATNSQRKSVCCTVIVFGPLGYQTARAIEEIHNSPSKLYIPPGRFLRTYILVVLSTGSIEPATHIIFNNYGCILRKVSSRTPRKGLRSESTIHFSAPICSSTEPQACQSCRIRKIKCERIHNASKCKTCYERRTECKAIETRKNRHSKSQSRKRELRYDSPSVANTPASIPTPTIASTEDIAQSLSDSYGQSEACLAFLPCFTLPRCLVGATSVQSMKIRPALNYTYVHEY